MGGRARQPLCIERLLPSRLAELDASILKKTKYSHMEERPIITSIRQWFDHSQQPSDKFTASPRIGRIHQNRFSEYDKFPDEPYLRHRFSQKLRQRYCWKTC